jgi:nitroimidazol reductase NimA-like FMN-containing flavoprotein (pyridoxamine 5'-phosphate oxidase superfamily)
VLYRGDMDSTVKPLSGAEIAAAKEVLREAPFAYLAVVDLGGAGAGGPYVVPLNFAYVEAEGTPGLDGRIYFHTGEGRKTAALAAEPRVCMALTCVAAFDQGDSPCSDGFSYRSLLVWGQARPIEDRDRREAALRAIVEKFDPGAAEAPFDEADFARTLLYEVAIEAAGFKERRPRSRG